MCGQQHLVEDGGDEIKNITVIFLSSRWRVDIKASKSVCVPNFEPLL